MSSESSAKKELSESQLKRIEANRLKALELRKARIANISKTENIRCQKDVNIAGRQRDTGGGFFLEEDGDDPCAEDWPVVSLPAPLFAKDRPICEECNTEFADSYLQRHFDCIVCDTCRDTEGEHCLISKTDAKKEYLLKDCDLDMREPPLKFVLKKNPHRMHGSMKLYLRLQVEKRAFDIYGSEEQLEEEREQRVDAKEKRKQKAFDKKIKALRMSVRSSLYRKKDIGHIHEFGPEIHDEDEDMYSTTCLTCGFENKYEKM